MPAIYLNYGNYQFWATEEEGGFPNQKVVFDGPNRIIFVNPGVRDLDVKVDIYSAWKEWSIASQEQGTASTWPKAITAIGGDPITDFQNVGATFFLENGWRIQPAEEGISYTLTISGNIYTREVGDTPFLFAEGASVSLVRSNIVDLIRGQTANLTDTDVANIAARVWEEIIDETKSQSAREKLRKIATKTQDIALRD